MKLLALSSGEGLDYSFAAENGRRNLLGERNKSYQLFPQGAKPIDLKYDERFSKELLPQHLLTAYFEQDRQEQRKKELANKGR